jgi:putative ABC transport system ATP-binding protein
LIRLENLAKVVPSPSGGSLTILQGIDLEFTPGSLSLVSGRSGAGKSTLLHVVGLLDSASRGRYLFDGNELDTSDADRLARLRGSQFGFVYQQFHLFAHQTALENVMAPLEYSPRSEQRSGEQTAGLLLKRFGVADRSDHLPTQLSGGEQQRVALARALIRRPRVLLADEPTGNLDTKIASELQELFVELASEGVTVIVASHDISLFAPVAAQHVELSDGRVASRRSRNGH